MWHLVLGQGMQVNQEPRKGGLEGGFCQTCVPFLAVALRVPNVLLGLHPRVFDCLPGCASAFREKKKPPLGETPLFLSS